MQLSSGILQSVGSQVRRIIAPNGGPMTGAGTNTYVIGEDALAVIDPGPAMASHVDAIIETTRSIGEIKWILVTHTHSDHSPAAFELAKRTGATLLGPSPIDDQFQDSSYKPHHEFVHDEIFSPANFSIKALHTPGHVGNHFCYLVEGDQMLMTGDHIMEGSTVVIIPPSGDMKDYIHSLEMLKAYPLNSLAPGHGDIINEPYLEVQKIVDHRLQRERKVIDGIKKLGNTTLEELTRQVYDDVDKSLHPIAQFSLWAHLIKLEKESLVLQENDRWLFRSQD